MIILIAPFALGLIVRLRSQRAAQPKVKVNQASDSRETPPASPGSDGEDKPEDSYWTRFKKWCSEHSLAIGLGITLVVATLIYIYREDISNLVYGGQPEEGKEKPKPSEEGKEKPKPSEEGEEEQAEEISILSLGEDICAKAFFKEDDDVDAKTFVEKAESFRRLCFQIDQHYSKKTVYTDKDSAVSQAFAYFKQEYPGLFVDRHSSPEVLKKDTDFFKSQLSKEPQKQNKYFKREFEFLSRSQKKAQAKEDYETFLNIVILWIEDRIVQSRQQTPEQQ